MDSDEDPDLLLAFDLAEAVVSANPAPQLPSSASIQSSSDIAVEPRSKLRICQWEYPPAQLAVMLAGRTIHSIQTIAQDSDSSKRLVPSDSKMIADWATIGVLSKKWDPKASMDGGDKRVTWVFSDYKVWLFVHICV